MSSDLQNQPSRSGPPELWLNDAPLRSAAAKAGAAPSHLATYAAALGQEEWAGAARAANRHPPELRLFDRGGRRLDQVEFHPAYHGFLRLGLGAGYAALPWQQPGGHATHAAMVYLHSQVEPSTCCPMTMTYAAYPALQANPALAALWSPRLLARAYDPSDQPASEKVGATIGMAMTEKQGGSDVRANITRAEAQGETYSLTGHKWFCSAPMSDAFLTLAQAPGGLTCFLAPRWRADGSRNAIHLMRLKDKLGNRANASAEIEYHGAEATRIGDEGQGVRAILEMVHHTRLDTAVAPAGLMRAALAEATWWAQGRAAFGHRLIDQPLMRAVLADLSLDWQGALALAMRVAQAFDGQTPESRAFARIAVALAKFINNKRCPVVITECMEILGGMGYVEDTPLPLLYREAPLNGIWEGCGNVICLDILRSLRRDPLAGPTLIQELGAAKGNDSAYDQALRDHVARWPTPPDEAEARWFAERTALLLTASILLQSGSPAAEPFIATRLAGQRGHVTGSISKLNTAALIDSILA